MLKPSEQAVKELDFLRSFDGMDITIRKAQLIGKIETRSQDSEYASSDEITIIQDELKGYRDQIRTLDLEI
jgi:hypothetical protein